MEETSILFATVLSSVSLLGIVITAIVGWIKFSSMAEQNKRVLCGYRNKNGSPIFRTEEECIVIHQDLVNMTCGKIDEIKQNIVTSSNVAQETRKELKVEITDNKKTVMAMFLEIKEFMGSTTRAINNLEKVVERR